MVLRFNYLLNFFLLEKGLLSSNIISNRSASFGFFEDFGLVFLSTSAV